jgi:glutathione synthase/RimK-type ligase-like ATP-grasp enzyme
MKVQLLSTERGMKSQSLKRIAKELSIRLGYKVFRTTQARADRKQFRYGHQVNKLSQYEWLQQKQISSLEFTTQKQEAQQWLANGSAVFGRKTLTGSEGKGIVIYEPGAQIPNNHGCEAFTKYKKKKREFRVHVFKGVVVSIVEKKKKHDWDGPSNPMIRNSANGYIFAQQVELTAALKKTISDTALAARKVTKSDFVGVDIGYNEHANDVFVIEVNSAPGVEGSNVEHYCDAITQQLA